MIKQFNFYDIYGYLLPGVLLLGMLWLPIGILTNAWPEQDLTKGVFLIALAYILGHLLRAVSSPLVPSKIADSQSRQRTISELLLDHSNAKFNGDFKLHLESQVKCLFGLSIEVAQDGDGHGKISSDRQVAFFQARSYLVAKKAAAYAEQFEGLYSMMRGLGCALLAGAAYIAGWALSFQKSHLLSVAAFALSVAALAGTLVRVWTHLWPKEQGSNHIVPACLWLVSFLGAGFCLGVSRPAAFFAHAPAHSEIILWAGVLLTLIAAAQCFSSYREFADHFAQTVWRDFSACLAYADTTAAAASSESDSEED
jgi:hypothetical protein